MIQTEKNKLKTDRAWKQLYGRFEQDGLLPEQSERKNGRSFHLQTFRWAAAILLVCLSATGILFWSRATPESSPLLTLHNGEETTTLVTTLEDGSIVYLANHTQLQYPEHFDLQRREVSLKGNALFDISGNRQRPFIIETGPTQIEVLGTAFNVKSNGTTTFELSVQRGEVRVMLKENKQTLHVTAGETVTLADGRLHSTPTADARQFARYTERIQFKDERLVDILRVINLHYPATPLETSPGLGERRLTVSFNGDSPEVMAKLICMALDLTCSHKNNRLILTEP